MLNYLSKEKPLTPEIDFSEGQLIPIDKPLEWTSFDVVNKLRNKIKYTANIPRIKVGHAGTLDPLATGLLLICSGKYTKRIDEFQGLDKVYIGKIRLGAQTPSYDAETDEENIKPFDHLTPQIIQENVGQFIGEIDQFPPRFSALKIKGRPAYKLAREGKEFQPESRKISIFDFKITNIQLPFIDFEVHCSKGTYIRSLAHDFGNALGVGGYLLYLRRTKIGDFNVADAWDLKDFNIAMDAIRPNTPE